MFIHTREILILIECLCSSSVLLLGPRSPEEVDWLHVPGILVLGVHIPARGPVLAPGHQGALNQSELSIYNCDQSELTMSPFLRSLSRGLLFMKFSPLSWR